MSAWLLRLAASRPRPLVVPVPYGTRARLAVEAEIDRRGWAPALVPAEASLLVVCGTPGDELAAAVERVWAAVPCPRALVRLTPDASAVEIAEALDDAMAHLADRDSQWRDAARPPPSPEHEEHLAHEAAPTDHDGEPTEHAAGHAEHDEHTDHDAGHVEHGEHADRGGHADGHAGHVGHGGGHAHHMGASGGLSMADRGADRDGLRLDRLHVPLGPVLADWPAGLVVETVLQGDVVQEATVHVAGGLGGEPFWTEPWTDARRGHAITRGDAERRRFVRHLDALGRLLAMAGWPDASAQARRLRDRALAGELRARLAPDFRRFGRRVGRSRVLRWMLRDVGPFPRRHGSAADGLASMADRANDSADQVRDGSDPAEGWAGDGSGPAEGQAGDVLDRVERWLAGAAAALEAFDDKGPLDGGDPPEDGAAGLEELPALLAGEELAAARLIVAGIDPDVERLGVIHGG